jgi:uncharacterized membrane protein YqjE
MAQQHDGRIAAAHSDPRSVGELFHELAQGIQKLVKNEVRLAKLELRDSAKEAKRGVVLMAIALVPAMIALPALAIAGIWALGQAMPIWAAALFVAAAGLAASGLLASTAKKHLKKIDLTPDRTVEQIEETREWLKHPLNG